MRTCRALLTVTTLSVLWSMPQMANACIVAYWGNDVDFASSEIDAWAYVDDSFNFGFCAQLVYEWGYFLHSYTASVEIEPPTGSPVSDSDSQPSVPYGGGSAYATATISFEDNPGVYTMQFQVGISCNLAGDVLSAFEQPNGGQVDLGISLGEGPTISGAVDLWWFNGESPSEYATSVTLTSGAGSSTQWSISAGSNIVSLSGTTGSTVVVTSTGRSETPNDVSVVATTSAGQTSHELTVRSPYRLQQTSNNLLIPCPYPGQHYMTQIAYEVYDKFDQVMARPVGINEYFPSGLEAEDIWPDHTWGGLSPANGAIHPEALVVDRIGATNNPSPFPGPLCPTSPAWDNNWWKVVMQWDQEWRVGSATPGYGVLVQTNLIQKLLGLGVHHPETIVSPVAP